MRRLGLVFLLLLTIGGFGLGGLIFGVATSAVHEIEALICFLIGTVALGFSVAVGVLEAVRDEVEVSTKMRASTPPPVPRA